MSNHTPGPWRVGQQSDEDLFCGFPEIVGTRASGRRCVVARANPNLINDDESHANARLIAAAPDLLESLCMAVKYLKGENMCSAMLPKFEHAIAKAEGRDA